MEGYANMESYGNMEGYAAVELCPPTFGCCFLALATMSSDCSISAIRLSTDSSKKISCMSSSAACHCKPIVLKVRGQTNSTKPII